MIMVFIFHQSVLVAIMLAKDDAGDRRARARTKCDPRLFLLLNGHYCLIRGRIDCLRNSFYFEFVLLLDFFLPLTEMHLSPRVEKHWNKRGASEHLVWAEIYH